ncbi:Receptor-type guanylate cyclase gcy-22 [Parelaphostrongylus tenuis]|uniref:Receptor-type guanylate cyclase gcy-22 n=1 Tax=Parelaphostrongylus tenuis TaxID=148309 RepID=A0AAD5RDU5_PARTN|nr:Receptor-type guanylate cyclase gcy-22 [Parelaphostrongylus tenuis]
MDTVFIDSILLDLTTGLTFLHDSFLKKHGRLSSLKLTQLLYKAMSRHLYSFAIIASELVTKKTAWDLDNRNETAEDGEQWCYGHVAEAARISSDIPHPLGSNPIGDRKKRQVAERLKLGEKVEPESYECVTVFFSDVVGFTTIASKGSPMQVVTLLNDLYTFFDSAIEEHDVYKVETIGDGYLCVSGLPIRNGLEHIKEICDLSLELVAGLRNFRISYLPTEKMNIRVGIHSGPVVAGVVGLKMPRYGLFGDTVNTASRMESNGKRLIFAAACIHISPDAYELLNSNHTGYATECRGEVIIKGKGVMQTYWLLGHQSGTDIRGLPSQEVTTEI